MVWHANSALLAILATAVSFSACADIVLKEIGSFHIGGHEAVLSGQPIKEVSFTAGMAPVKVDPNGQFEIEQMYVQYFKLGVPFWAHRIIRPQSSKSPTVPRQPVPDRSARPIRQTGGSALGDERRTDAGCLRSARRTGLSLRHHRSQPGRKLWLQRSLARARQNQSACGHRAIGSP